MGLIDNKHITREDFRVGNGDRGLVLAHLSDLHIPRQAIDTEELFSLLAAWAPDLVVMTGDLVWKKSTDISEALFFAEKLAARFPFFFSEGNHEADGAAAERVERELLSRGVTVVTGRVRTFEKRGVRLVLAGAPEHGDPPELPAEGFRILLSHHPERAAKYAARLAPDLILSGHAHGGQFRFFGRGVYAPGQGLFPKYTAGEYEITPQTRMIVSRGIGKSRFPFRFNNPPHVPIITIKM